MTTSASSKRDARAKHNIKLRSGIPQRGGQLVKAARDAGYPVLFSAGAYAKFYPEGHERYGSFRAFAKPDEAQLNGMDSALDSSGYIAGRLHGDYPWTVNAYVDNLAGVRSWQWWASMDFCCEPEIATDVLVRTLRIAATVYNFGACRRAAERRGISNPMPVLQGWSTRDYLMCVDWFPVTEWPSLVGIGSMCRRQIHGPNGILQITEALAGALPSHVHFHLFGVKGAALAALSHQPRVHSIDSMAWDMRARALRRTGRDMTFRIDCMRAWLDDQQKQVDVQSTGAGLQGSLLDPTHWGGATSVDEMGRLAVALEGAAVIVDGQDEYGSVLAQSRYDAMTAIDCLRQKQSMRRRLATLERTLPGVGKRLARLLANDPSAYKLEATS